jgi:hypothetical protein
VQPTNPIFPIITPTATSNGSIPVAYDFVNDDVYRAYPNANKQTVLFRTRLSYSTSYPIESATFATLTISGNLTNLFVSGDGYLYGIEVNTTAPPRVLQISSTGFKIIATATGYKTPSQLASASYLYYSNSATIALIIVQNGTICSLLQIKIQNGILQSSTVLATIPTTYGCDTVLPTTLQDTDTGVVQTLIIANVTAGIAGRMAQHALLVQNSTLAFISEIGLPSTSIYNRLYLMKPTLIIAKTADYLYFAMISISNGVLEVIQSPMLPQTSVRDIHFISLWDFKINSIVPAFSPLNGGASVKITGKQLIFGNWSSIQFYNNITKLPVTNSVQLVHCSNDYCMTSPKLLLDLGSLNYIDTAILFSPIPAVGQVMSYPFTYYRNDLTELSPTTAFPSDNIILTSTYFTVSSAIQCQMTVRFTNGSTVSIDVTATCTAQDTCLCTVPYFNIHNMKVFLTMSTSGQVYKTPSALFFYYMDPSRTIFLETFDTTNGLDDKFDYDMSLQKPLPMLSIGTHQIQNVNTFDNSTGRSLLQLSNNLFGGTRRALSTQSNWGMIDRQAFIEFYVDSSVSVGNVIEFWLYASNSSVMSELTIWGNGTSSLRLFQNVKAENKQASTKCNFILGTFYMMNLRMVRPHYWFPNSTETWKLVTELIDSAQQKIICKVEYTDATMTYAHFLRNVYNVSYALVISQSSITSADLRRALPSTQSITIFVDRVGIECQVDFCGGLDNFAVYPIPEEPSPGMSLLEILLYTLLPAGGAAAVLVGLLALGGGLLYRHFNQKLSVAQQEEDDFDTMVGAWDDENFSGYSVARKKYPQHLKM